MPAVFITGTGTDIGKTFVSLGLITYLCNEGRKVAAIKPVLSGFDPAAPADSDSARLLRALGGEADSAAIAAVSPWRFAAPVSPDMAARRENRRIDFDRLVEFCRAAIAEAEDLLLIEGVGGVMVPLNERSTVLDLVAALAVPAVLVAGTYLGTLSHVLTALAAARLREIEIRAIILNETPGTFIPVEETVATLANFCGPIPILSLGRDAGPENDAFFARLVQIICQSNSASIGEARLSGI